MPRASWSAASSTSTIRAARACARAEGSARALVRRRDARKQTRTSSSHGRLVPAIHALLEKKDVDAPDKRGHDDGEGQMPSLNELSCTEIVQGIAAGKFTAEAVTRDCLERIKAREDSVKAWAIVDPD